VPLESVRRTGAVDALIAQMQRMIRSGEWPINQRIPSEAELAKVFGVGRNTMR
jgi:DNA-binding FadR family transcriptional regulator